jgi:transcriptional regulator with XRE-family HTH domain
MSFGQKLAHLRNREDLSQHELAKLINVSRASISFYETARREPTRDTFLRIAKYFTVSVDYLIDDSIPVNYNESAKYYESKFGPLDCLIEEDIQHIKSLIDLLNKKNSK